MSNPSNENDFVTYPRHVEAGLGFPNGRESESPEPTGWVRAEIVDVANVSRETFGKSDANPDLEKSAE